MNEVSTNSTDKQPIVALLIINRLGILASITIESIINNSRSKIVIGFVEEKDVADLPKSERVSYMSLTSEATNLGLRVGNEDYWTFDDDYFFSIVQLKWCLIRNLLVRNPKVDVIYTDVDVLWVSDASIVASEAFKSLRSAHLLVQNFTHNPSEPRLCMGFAAFRNSEYSLNLIEDCSKMHNKMLKVNPRFGDDDVITQFYKENSIPNQIVQLPQTSFPVGNQLNLFSKRNVFPGLIPEKPIIFHANYVIGLRKKVELLYLLSKIQGIPTPSLSYNQRMSMTFIIFARRIWNLLRLFASALYVPGMNSKGGK